MKRIFIIDEHITSKQNGVGTYIRQLLKCFEDSELEVNLLSFNADGKELLIERKRPYNEYHIPVCGMGGFLENGSLTLPLLRLYIEDTPENVFFMNHSPSDVFLRVLHRLFPRSRLVYVIHDQGWCALLLGDRTLFRQALGGERIPKKKQALCRYACRYARKERRMYRLVNAVVALTFTTEQLLREVYGVPENKIHVIPNGSQLVATVTSPEERHALRRRLGIGETDCVLLYTGRTVKSKGLWPLLKAFEQLWSVYPHLRLVISGQVFTLNEFAQLTPRSASRITYTGLIPFDSLQDWYRIADIGVLPSYTEQCSYTGMEMLAYGKLIVSTDGHCLTDMFNEGNALIAPITDTDRSEDAELTRNLAIAIERALNLLPSERESLQRKARQYYEEHYTLPLMRRNYFNLIQRLYSTDA